jgi:hypothetical protein
VVEHSLPTVEKPTAAEARAIEMSLAIAARESRYQGEDRTICFYHLLPIVGWLFAIWTLQTGKTDGLRGRTAYQSLWLTGSWFVSYITLGVASNLGETIGFRLLFLSGMLTSGYFIALLLLMAVLRQKKSVR